MTVGTLGAYFIIIVANNNQNEEIAKQQELLKQLQEQQKNQPECKAVDTDRQFTKPEAVTFDKASVTELRTEDVTVGDGTEVTSPTACVTVHYLGNLSDGKVFDNSYDRGEPTAFRLDQVIKGWTEGFQGMKAGGKRIIYIPADKAYGEAGSPPNIGPNEPLVFTVELIGIQP
jgi:FKBP-type peptidyl-prolyl cis-trans isomerase